MNSDEITVAAKAKRAALTRDLGELDPIEDEAITTGRIRLRMLEDVLKRCEAGPVSLTDDEKRLLE